METPAWSPEPWQVAEGVSGLPDTVTDARGVWVAICPGPRGPANAQRIAAVANALADSPSDQLDNGPLLKAAAALYAACRVALASTEAHGGRLTEDTLAKLRAAVARAEGG